MPLMTNYLRKLNEKYVLIPKLIYLIVNLQFYGFHQLRSAFATEKFEISPKDYGTYTGYVQCITFLTNIFIGNLTDKLQRYQRTFLTLIVLSTVMFSLFYVDPLMKMGAWVFWACLLLYLVFNNPKQPLSDKIMIEYLDKHSEHGSKIYGKQRLWGTFALPIATYLCEWFTNMPDGSSNYTNLLYYNLIATFFAIMVVLLFISAKDEKAKASEMKEKAEKASQKAGSGLLTKGTVVELFKNKEFVFFIIVIFLNAISRSALTIYLQLFHKDILKIESRKVPENASFFIKTFCSSFYDKPVSTLATAGVIFEIIILFTSDKIIEKCGYFMPLLIAQSISLIRFLTYYLLPSDYAYRYPISCIVELTRGMYFGLIHISSVHIASKMAPQYLRTTSQMVYQGTFSALGFLISGYMFGSFFEAKLAKDLAFVDKEMAYRQIFLINILIAGFTIFLCIVKYGMIDKVLFNRENEKKKLAMYDFETTAPVVEVE